MPERSLARLCSGEQKESSDMVEENEEVQVEEGRGILQFIVGIVQAVTGAIRSVINGVVDTVRGVITSLVEWMIGAISSVAQQVLTRIATEV